MRLTLDSLWPLGTPLAGRPAWPVQFPQFRKSILATKLENVPLSPRPRLLKVSLCEPTRPLHRRMLVYRKFSLPPSLSKVKKKKWLACGVNKVFLFFALVSAWTKELGDGFAARQRTLCSYHLPRFFFLKILFPPLHYRQLLDHFSFFVEKTSWGIIVFGRKRATRYLLFHHSLPSLTCTRARATSSVFSDPFQSCYSAVVRLTPRTETTIV